MAFFTGFFDESGKHQSHKVVSFCGLLEPNWGPLEDEWAHLLRKYRLGALHLSKDSLKATNKQIDMYRQFVQVIVKHVEHGFGIAVDVQAFNSTHKAMRKFYREDAHYLAFHSVIRDVVKYLSKQTDPAVSIVCDNDPQKACDTFKSFDLMRQNTGQPENKRILKSITFADAKFFTQLQAADLFPWVCRAEALYRFSGEAYSLRDLWSEFNLTHDDRRIRYSTGFWNAEYLAELSANIVKALGKREIARIEKA